MALSYANRIPWYVICLIVHLFLLNCNLQARYSCRRPDIWLPEPPALKRLYKSKRVENLACSSSDGGSWLMAPIPEENLYVVDAQGFYIRGPFHGRELYISNVLMTIGMELDLDISLGEIQRL